MDIADIEYDEDGIPVRKSRVCLQSMDIADMDIKEPGIRTSRLVDSSHEVSPGSPFCCFQGDRISTSTHGTDVGFILRGWDSNRR